MQPCMVIVVPLLASYAKVRHVHVSLPLVPELLDGVKYREPADLAEAEQRQQEEHAAMKREQHLQQKAESARRCRQQRRAGVQPQQPSDRDIELLDRLLAE